MRSYRSFRSLAWLPLILAAFLSSTVCLAKAKAPSPDQHEAQAQVLDHAELLCDNCFFGLSDYYFCFAADNRILIAYQATPVFNFRDSSKNYLTKAHKGWAAWAPAGATVPILYNETNIWVTREDGKQVKLTQTYSRDVFTANPQCHNAVKAKVQ